MLAHVQDPGTCMQEEFKVTAVASLVNLVNSKETTETGGVIVALASRTDINGLEDIQGKKVRAKKRSLRCCCGSGFWFGHYCRLSATV